MRLARGQTPVELSSEVAAEVRAVFRKLKLRLREQGGESGLAPSQVSVLLRLETGGALTVSSLAQSEGMRHQSMRAIVASLVEAGLISGAPDPSD